MVYDQENRLLQRKMKKYLKHGTCVNLARYSGEMVLDVQVSAEAIQGWGLALCLLKEDLIDAFVVVAEEKAKGPIKLELSCNGQPSGKSCVRIEEKKASLAITLNDLDYLLHYFLKYYRDGIGEVDHVDLEVVNATEAVPTSVTFKVPLAVEPLSAEEAKRRLGLI